jgi:hypothetical protein
MKKSILLLFLILSISFVHAENSYMSKESYNWFFGGNAGISFNTPDLTPTAIENSQIFTMEGCAAISDNRGNLLFYTDGFIVWNKDHEYMDNGTELNGSYSSTQSAIIVKDPGNENQYYIFTVDYQIGDNGFCYSIVDITKENGLGSVVVKNVKLMDETTEKLTCALHKNGKHIWVIVHGWNNSKFYAFKVTEKGVESDPVVSDAGVIHTGGQLSNEPNENKVGYMRVSPEGNKLACAIRLMRAINIFDFDNETGIISNPILLRDDKFDHPYGLEFSLDSRFLYVSKLTGKDRLYQIDLEEKSEADMKKNAVPIDVIPDEGDYLGGIQTGPDGRIYVAQSNTNYLAAINEPNKKGTACDFRLNAVDLKSGKCYQGLPNFTQLDFSANIYIAGLEDFCEGDSVHLVAEITTPLDIDSYLWKGPNGVISNTDELLIPNISKVDQGKYSVEIEGNNISYIKMFQIIVNDKPEVSINGKFTIKQGETVTLEAITDEQNLFYSWSDGSTESSIEVTEPGNYFVKVETENGCKDTAYHTVKRAEGIEARIAGPEYICDGSEVFLLAYPNHSDYEYLWSTGDTTQMIRVQNAGFYSVIVTTDLGETGIAEKELKRAESPKAEIMPQGKTEFCDGERLILKAYKEEGYEISWSSGEFSDQITVSEDGKYILTVQNEWGCIDQDTIEITVYPTPEVTLESNIEPVLCSGESITLYVLEDHNNYYWSTGETGKEIHVTEPGEYSVTVENEYGCVADASIEIVPAHFEFTFSDVLQDGAFDFGSIERMQHKTKNITMYNHSSHFVYVKSIEAVQNTGNAYAVVHANTPAKLEIGESMDISLTFNPDDIGIYEAELKVDITEPCDHEIRTPVKGMSSIKTIVWLPDTSAIIGDTEFRIPLKAKLETPDDYSILMSYRAEIRYLADMYLPTSSILGVIDDFYLEDDQRVLVIEGEDIVVSNKETILAELEGIILLGDQNETPLIISDFAYRSEFIDFTTINGRLLISGLCFQDGSRVTLMKLIEAVISPNPVTGSVKVELNNCIEGSYILTIYNTQGQEIRTIKWKNGKDKSKILELDLSDLPAGVYRLSISAPFQNISYQITVLN